METDKLTVTIDGSDVAIIEVNGKLPSLSAKEVSAAAIELAYLLYDSMLGLYFGNLDVYVRNEIYRNISIETLNISIHYDFAKMDFKSVEKIARKTITLFGYPENSEMSNGLEFGDYFETMMRNYNKARKVYDIGINDRLYILPVNNLNTEYKEGSGSGSFEAFAAGLSLGAKSSKWEDRGSFETSSDRLAPGSTSNKEDIMYEDFLINMIDGHRYEKSYRQNYTNISDTLKDVMSWMKYRKDKVCQLIDVDGTNCIRMLDDNIYKYKVYFIIERIVEMISSNDIYAVDFGTKQILRLISNISLYDTHDTLLINKMMSEAEITYEEAIELLEESISNELIDMLDDKESYTELFRNTIQFIFGYARKICVAFNYDKKELSRLVKNRWIVAKSVHECAYTNK